jgi:hypothetical protein
MLVALLVALTLALTPFAVADPRADAPRAPVRALFIGNSATYYNNLPRLTAALAASAADARRLETEMITVGGATLKRHWDDGIALAAIRRGGWQYVVLQEQTTLGPIRTPGIKVNDPAMFHDYARRFDAEIKRAGATTVFFLTWARRDRPETQAAITRAYTMIAAELGARVAPVGVAWERALSSNPALARSSSQSASRRSLLAASRSVVAPSIVHFARMQMSPCSSISAL